MEKLRPDNNNGDAIALASIALAVAVLVTFIRMGGPWAAGINLIYTALAATIVLGLAYLSPIRDRPAPYQTVLYVAGFGLALLALLNLADVLGADGLGAGTRVWVTLALVALTGYIAWFRNSGVMTFFCALLKIVLILSLVDWLFDPREPLETYRWLLAILAFVFIAVVVFFDVIPQKYRQLAVVDAAGFALLALSLTFLSGLGLLLSGSTGTSAGWELVIALGSLLLIAYAMIDGDPGPAYLGGFNLIAFSVIAATTDEPSFVWWPLILLLIAIGAFAVAYSGRRIPGLSAMPSLKITKARRSSSGYSSTDRPLD